MIKQEAIMFSVARIPLLHFRFNRVSISWPGGKIKGPERLRDLTISLFSSDATIMEGKRAEFPLEQRT